MYERSIGIEAASAFHRFSGQRLIDKRWPYKPTSIDSHTPGMPLATTEDWLVFPGFGSMCGLAAATLLEPHLPADRSRSSLTVSPDGSSPPEIGRKFADYVAERRVKKLAVMVHSMGLLRFMWALKDVDVEISRILIDSGATSRRSIRYARGVELGSSILQRTGYRGGVGGKYGVALFRQCDRYGIAHPVTRMKAAKQDTITGASPRRQANEIRELGIYLQAELLQHPEWYAGKITSNTHIGFCHAEDHSRDRSIILDVALAETERFALAFDAPFEAMPIKDANHGNYDKSILRADDWLQRTNIVSV